MRRGYRDGRRRVRSRMGYTVRRGDRDGRRRVRSRMGYTVRRKQRGCDWSQVYCGLTCGGKVSFFAPWCIILKALNDSGTYCFKDLRLFTFESISL